MPSADLAFLCRAGYVPLNSAGMTLVIIRERSIDLAMHNKLDIVRQDRIETNPLIH